MKKIRLSKIWFRLLDNTRFALVFIACMSLLSERLGVATSIGVGLAILIGSSVLFHSFITTTTSDP